MRHIQYLGHLISETCIKPLPEKLSSLQDVPPPRNPKEVKQLQDCMCRFLILFDIMYIEVSLKQNTSFHLVPTQAFSSLRKMLSFLYLYTQKCIRKYVCLLYYY